MQGAAEGEEIRVGANLNLPHKSTDPSKKKRKRHRGKKKPGGPGAGPGKPAGPGAAESAGGDD
jgi:hypothetical protein